MAGIGKKIIYSIWLAAVGGFLIAYLVNPQIGTPEYIAGFMQQFGDEILWVYAAVMLIRGFFLIPSTPFVIVGGILFPERFLLVLSISMLGVLFSATTLYYFSDLLGFSGYLERNFPKQIRKWEARLQQPRATLFVIAWSFFPLVPTDLLCYITGIVKMPFRNMIAGVFIGESLLNVIYLLLGANLFKMLL